MLFFLVLIIYIHILILLDFSKTSYTLLGFVVVSLHCTPFSHDLSKWAINDSRVTLSDHLIFARTLYSGSIVRAFRSLRKLRTSDKGT